MGAVNDGSRDVGADAPLWAADITTLLPGSPMMSVDGYPDREAFSGLDPHSYDFFSRHYPKHPLASLHMATKGAILLGRKPSLRSAPAEVATNSVSQGYRRYYNEARRR